MPPPKHTVWFLNSIPLPYVFPLLSFMIVLNVSLSDWQTLTGLRDQAKTLPHLWKPFRKAPGLDLLVFVLSKPLYILLLSFLSFLSISKSRFLSLHHHPYVEKELLQASYSGTTVIWYPQSAAGTPFRIWWIQLVNKWKEIKKKNL